MWEWLSGQTAPGWASVVVASIALLFAGRSFRNSKKQLRVLLDDKEMAQAGKVYFTKDIGSEYNGERSTFTLVNGADLPINDCGVVVLGPDLRVIAMRPVGLLGPNDRTEVEFPKPEQGAIYVYVLFIDASSRSWIRSSGGLIRAAPGELNRAWNIAKSERRMPRVRGVQW